MAIYYVKYFVFLLKCWFMQNFLLLLSQVRLCLDRQDYVRAQILSRKISARVFEADPLKGKKPKEGDTIPTRIEAHLLWTDDSVCDASQSLMHYWRAIWLSGVIWNWEKLLLHPRNFYSWFGFGSGPGACSEDIQWTCLGFAHHLGFLSLWFRLSSMLYSRRQLRRCWCSLALKPRWVPTSSSSLAPH